MHQSMTSTRIVGSADTRALTVAVVGAGSWVGYVHIFADSGLRLDELTRLTAGDLIRGGRQLHLRVHGKRDRVRDVPVPPRCAVTACTPG